jgi:hypothetical protein
MSISLMERLEAPGCNYFKALQAGRMRNYKTNYHPLIKRPPYCLMLNTIYYLNPFTCGHAL